jgi:hypothetical protein
VFDKAGKAVADTIRTYPVSYFEQFSLASIASAALKGDEVVIIEVQNGRALLYASSTDNVTQDPAIQVGRPVD